MAGAGYKLFNTGDVLTAAQVNTYLMEQTVMVFADAAARTTALTGVVSEGMLSYLKSTKQVEVYNGSAWVASDDPNAIQNTIVDAKGDLITATAADTPARLAVGNNGETIVADSAATTGLRWQGNYAAGKNKIINSDFTISQRGSTFSAISSSQYILDRWRFENNGTGTATISQTAFTPGAAPVAGYESPFFLKMTANSVGTSTNFDITQRIEDVRTFANQTITISFWAKADSARTVTPILGQNYGSGGSSSDFTFGTGISVSTSWARYSQTFNVPSISGKTVGSSSFFQIFLRTTAATGLVLDLWGVQVEAGSVATPFTTATGTIQGELAACQRYYERITLNSSFARYGAGIAASSTVFNPTIYFKVAKRIAPTVIDFANVQSWDGGLRAITSIAFSESSDGCITLQCNVASGLTATRTTEIIANGANSYIGIIAEL